MKVFITLLTILSYSQECEIANIQENSENVSSIASNKCHSRQKRYIIFPKGSSLQLAIELLPRLEAPNELEVGPTIGVAWPLPTDAKQYLVHRRVKRNKNISPMMDSYIKTHLSYFKNFYHPLKSIRMKPGVKLSNKFKVFDDLAMLLDFSGMKGKHCVLRALCESGQRTAAKKSFITEIMHKVFWINDEDEEHETHEDEIYRRAYRSVNQNCGSLYTECGFSIFEMLRKY